MWRNNFKDQQNERIFFSYNDEEINAMELYKEKAHFVTKAYILEMLVLFACPIPYYDTYITATSKDNLQTVYFLSEILVAIMWLRIYFLVRTLFNFSIYSDHISKNICRSYNFEASFKYTIKCQLKNNPEFFVFVLMLGSLCIASYIVRIFELPYYRLQAGKDSPGQLDSFFNAFYMTTITLTTVGYGDLSPCTPPGRFILLLMACWGAFLISLLVVTLSGMFSLEQEQMMAMRRILITRRAAKTITSAFKYFITKKRLYLLRKTEEPEAVEHSVFLKQIRPIRYQDKRNQYVIKEDDDDMFTS